MIFNKHQIQTSLNRSLPFLVKLSKIFAGMDGAYDLAADHYGFHCAGCEDNCCRTKFYHHTFLEYLYLYQGYKNLEPDRQADIEERARAVIKEMEMAENKKIPFRMICPLNHNDRCRVYTHRPMICRMHGIPHELQKPGQDRTFGPGCAEFTKIYGKEKYFQFDRTPFYIKIAELETDLKQTLSIGKRLKMTVAEMVVTWNDSV